ncbi:nuclear transport factor 2 family protein [Rhodococcus sp. NPDC127530]|uniref:nuclear transport factor 2 family protein n=1 Tax=unclassified Rhodococcus (in: high G+C Gram-positive bacteria) TaxID=192944 RepID=UPI003640D89B
MSASNDDKAQVIESYRAMYRGMLERDTALLDDLLGDEYTLTHMTGFLQAKKEWLEQIDSGEMQYHSSQERCTSVEVTGATAVLVGRSTVDATIWGSRGTWNLQLTTTYERLGGEWIAMRTVATTY